MMNNSIVFYTKFPSEILLCKYVSFAIFLEQYISFIGDCLKREKNQEKSRLLFSSILYPDCTIKIVVGNLSATRIRGTMKRYKTVIRNGQARRVGHYF